MNDPDAKDGPYADAWRRQRVWERLLWVVPLGGAAALVVVIQISVSITRRPADWLRPFGFLWFIGSAVVVIRRSLFRCPRCRKPFYRRRFWKNDFARRCMNCGLPKWAPGPEDKSQPQG
jgi:hypothetical protein